MTVVKVRRGEEADNPTEQEESPSLCLRRACVGEAGENQAPPDGVNMAAGR